jgi:hypothetical protein
VTLVPSHILFSDSEIETLTGISGLTVTCIWLLVTVAGVAQTALEVNCKRMILLLLSVVVRYEDELAPVISEKGLPPLVLICHW